MKPKLNVLDIFSGIGGFSIGLERTNGFKTAAFCEIDPFARRVLAKHWPETPIYEDVRALTVQRLAADGLPRIDVICGGFPCTNISDAGKRTGIDSARDIYYRFSQPEPIRVVDGVPGRMDRNRVIGNAVVPQIPEMIGHAILADIWHGDA